jgi:superfamily II RNA helicase
MFSGMFNDLKPETLVAICSVLVYEEKNDEKVPFHFLSSSLLPPRPLLSSPSFYASSILFLLCR